MIKKLGFSIPEEMGNDLANTINIVKNNAGALNYRFVPIDSIEFDPDNPRELSITREDVINGLDNSDSLFEIKLKELESLKQMAETVKQYGVRNPVEIYKHGSTYRLIHGERRCLSSILAGKKEIPAKILNEKPNSFDIKMLQLIENVQRENLSLYEYLNNIKAVIDEYKKNDPNVEMTLNFIEKIVNKSQAQCANILTVLTADDELKEHIKNGGIKSLEKAAVIACVKDAENRRKLIDICLKGEPLSGIKLDKEKLKKENLKGLQINSLKIPNIKKNKLTNRVVLGETRNKLVISKIVSLVLKDPKYKSYTNTFKNVNYEDYRSCAIAFKTLVNIMESVENDC